MDMQKYEDLQNLDLCIREVQISLDTIRKYKDCEDIIFYTNYLEKFRSDTHKKMDSILKSK